LARGVRHCRIFELDLSEFQDLVILLVTLTQELTCAEQTSRLGLYIFRFDSFFSLETLGVAAHFFPTDHFFSWEKMVGRKKIVCYTGCILK